MIKTIIDFFKFQSYLGSSYPSRQTVEEAGKEMQEKHRELFWRLRVSELEEQVKQLEYNNIVLTSANKELKRQNAVVASWYISKAEHDEQLDHMSNCFAAEQDKRLKVEKELKQAEEDVEIWKQKWLSK